eukprot:COSAG02_NODE_19429_length_882_cov_1.367816_1_plen_83_part_00
MLNLNAWPPSDRVLKELGLSVSDKCYKLEQEPARTRKQLEYRQTQLSHAFELLEEPQIMDLDDVLDLKTAGGVSQRVQVVTN